VNTLNIYTDGSSLQHPRTGGIGIRLLTVADSGDEEARDISLPGFKGASNNQMELQACIAALREALDLPSFATYSKIVIHTDSLYVTQNYQKAMFQWPKTKWLLTSGPPVANADLWKSLVKAIRSARKRVEFRWVKGHSKNEHNKAADRLAKGSARNPVNPALSVVNVRRKLSPHSVSPGSVQMMGQRITIRIVTAQYLTIHHLWKCKFEVLSRASPFYQCVDFAYASDLLKAGHSYSVRLGNNPANPTIEKVFREIVR